MLMFHFSSCGMQNTNILFSTIDFRVRVPGQKDIIHYTSLTLLSRLLSPPCCVQGKGLLSARETIYIRPQRPLCSLLVRYGPPETDLCPAQSIPGHKPSRRAAAPHQPRRPAARASHRAGNKSVPRQSIASAKRISRVPIKFSKKPLPRAAVRLPTEVLQAMLCRRRY